MANISYLQLYLDTDYLLPVVVGADGNLVKYQNKEGESRLWLYFQRVAGRDVYESGATFKANYGAKQTGTLGDFWNHLETDDKVEGEPYGYVELLELGGLLDALRNWCRPMLGTATPQVVLNFATTIGVKARMAFVDYLQKKGFTIRSYSTEINDLLAEKVVNDHSSTMERNFGDQLLILQSTGNLLLLSTMTWCGDIFLQGDKPTEIKKEGDDFKDTTLATMVVEKMESQKHKLLPEEKPGEIVYQTQFAKTWSQTRINDIIWVNGFHYSRSKSIVYPPIQIDGKQYDLLVEANERETIQKVERYYAETIKATKANHLHTILVGELFTDEKFCQNCIKVTESPGKCTFFNDNALQEAMGRYYFNYAAVEEPIGELEKRYLTKGMERERIRKYVKNAKTLGSLRIDIATCQKDVENAIDGLKSRSVELERSWEAYMKESKFEEAKKCLAGMSTDDHLTAALNQLMQTLGRLEANTSLITELKQMNQQHVKDIVVYVEQGRDRLTKLKNDAKELEQKPNELRDRTRHYEDVYPQYLEKKKALNRETSLGGKRRVLKEITDGELTMEPLPQVDVETVTVGLTCELQTKKSGFLGLKKETILNVSLHVADGKSLPFLCVLVISDRNQIRLTREYWNADIAKGSTTWNETIPVSDLPASSNGSYVVQLFPGEANSHLTESIYCEKKNIKVK